MATPDSVRIAAGQIVDGTITGTFHHLVNHLGKYSASEVEGNEWQEVLDYLGKWEDPEEYHSIKLMLACFTLLLEGDDGF